MALALHVSNNATPNQNHHLLNLWWDVMLESQWTFNQCAGIGAPLSTANDKAGIVYLQKEREYIARELESACSRMSADLNYWLVPAYFSQIIPIGRGRPIGNQVFQGRWMKMIELGSRATALIQSNATVTYSDPNQVGVDDTATVTINTTIADDEIKLYFRTTDGAPSAGDYRYEVEPIEVSNNGAGVVTITAHRSLFVKPTQWKREYKVNDPNFNSPNIVDTSDVNSFVTGVDVYRVYTDQSANIELLDSNNNVLQTYSGYILDAELSAFRLGYLCTDWCGSCGAYPVSIRVNYKAGSPLVNNYPDSELYEACVAYASARMQSELTGMSYWALENWRRWNKPMVDSVSGNVIPVATTLQSNSRYGARRGEVQAWGCVLDRRIERGHKFF